MDITIIWCDHPTDEGIEKDDAEITQEFASRDDAEAKMLEYIRNRLESGAVDADDMLNTLAESGDAFSIDGDAEDPVSYLVDHLPAQGMGGVVIKHYFTFCNNQSDWCAEFAWEQ